MSSLGGPTLKKIIIVNQVKKQTRKGKNHQFFFCFELKGNRWADVSINRFYGLLSKILAQYKKQVAMFLAKRWLKAAKIGTNKLELDWCHFLTHSGC